MRILKWTLGILAGLAMLMGGIGLVLPQKFTLTRSIVVNTAPDRVYAQVDDPRRWKNWAAWQLRDPNIAINYTGQERGVEKGVGAGATWMSRSEGSGSMRFTSAETGRRLSYEMVLDNVGLPWQGELRFAAAGLGTKVSWTVNGDLGDGPFTRWMGLFVDGLMGKDLETNLANLKAQAERR